MSWSFSGIGWRSWGGSFGDFKISAYDIALASVVFFPGWTQYATASRMSSKFLLVS